MRQWLKELEKLIDIYGSCCVSATLISDEFWEEGGDNDGIDRTKLDAAYTKEKEAKEKLFQFVKDLIEVGP